MKQFFKFVFATMVGIILTSFILILIIAGVIGAIVASGEKHVDVESNSVLHIALNNPIPERTPNNPLSGLSFLGIEGDKAIGLNDILGNIKKAKTDPNIKGIFLDQSYLMSGLATTEEIRNALIDLCKIAVSILLIP